MNLIFVTHVHVHMKQPYLKGSNPSASEAIISTPALDLCLNPLQAWGWDADSTGPAGLTGFSQLLIHFAQPCPAAWLGPWTQARQGWGTGRTRGVTVYSSPFFRAGHI